MFDIEERAKFEGCDSGNLYVVRGATERKKKWGTEIKFDIPFLSALRSNIFITPPPSNFPFIRCSFTLNMCTTLLRWCSRKTWFQCSLWWHCYSWNLHVIRKDRQNKITTVADSVKAIIRLKSTWSMSQAHYLVSFHLGWNFAPLTGLKHCCDYMLNYLRI